MKTAFYQRRPLIKDDLKVLKVEYLSIYGSDCPQILNLSLGDQTKIERCLKLRGPPVEDDLKILKIYFSNH